MMRYTQTILKCLAALIVSCIIFAEVGDDFAHFLFSTVYSGLVYPLPLSIFTAFVIILVGVVASYYLARKICRR